MLTTEAFLSCPWLLAFLVACTASLRAFFFYKHTGKPPKYFETHGRQHVQTNNLDTFHFKRAAFYIGIKSKVGLVLAKAAALRITLNLDGAPIPSRAYTHTSHNTI